MKTQPGRYLYYTGGTVLPVVWQHYRSDAGKIMPAQQKTTDWPRGQCAKEKSFQETITLHRNIGKFLLWKMKIPLSTSLLPLSPSLLPPPLPSPFLSSHKQRRKRITAAKYKLTPTTVDDKKKWKEKRSRDRSKYL